MFVSASVGREIVWDAEALQTRQNCLRQRYELVIAMKVLWQSGYMSGVAAVCLSILNQSSVTEEMTDCFGKRHKVLMTVKHG